MVPPGISSYILHPALRFLILLLTNPLSSCSNSSMSYLPKPLQKLTKRQRDSLVLIFLLFLFAFYPLLSPVKTFAAPTAYFMPDRMLTSTSTGGSVCFNPTSNETTVGQMAISFPGNGTQGAASFGVNTTGSNWTWDTTNIPPGTTAFPGTASTSTVSTNTVTFKVSTAQTLNTGTTYCLHFTGTNTLTTPTAANSNLTGTIQLNNTSGTLLTGESDSYATASVSNDQLAVTASVGQTFSFSLTAGNHALGALSSSTVTSSPSTSTGTISTNARNGYTVWVKSANGALLSTSTGATITAGTFASGSNVVDLSSNTGYVLDCQNSTNTPCNAGSANFKGNGSTSGGKLPTTFQVLAGGSAPTTSDAFTLAARAKISTTQTPASDYADTITVSAAGQF